MCPCPEQALRNFAKDVTAQGVMRENLVKKVVVHNFGCHSLHQAAYKWYLFPAVLQGEDLTDHFLRILTDLAVTHCLTGETSSMTARPGLLYFIAVDAYVRLLIMLITGGCTFTWHCCVGSVADLSCILVM